MASLLPTAHVQFLPLIWLSSLKIKLKYKHRHPYHKERQGRRGFLVEGEGLIHKITLTFCILTEKLFNIYSLAKTFENIDELLINTQPILGRKAWHNGATLYIHYPSQTNQ